ncbi:saccharopine dehydrogenase (NAD+, L-lysine-forming) [Kitasatospora sp. MAP12-15]|uniref:saccharopine dehydrogenase n=1 Tax=unclassified Kitasatospora TaxID=2633591 RepID=UPI0024736AC3|nr:saccharopine dehydrogenase [Kitasatospora sp. MAP12-44]MDH6110345.1 saccharopine dehydrogenase (NAD+, L-lysine-forming) [Kitasatospora sp. MAP12-44]
MADMPRLWIRHEARSTERRAPIVPADARRLVEHGFQVTVEESPQRVFPLEEYTAAGCETAPAGGWSGAPQQAYVLGLKELPEDGSALTHRHIFFGHAYKGQQGSRELLGRFNAGGGALLDLEYLVDDMGRRLAAFGYWAGYVGAALAVLHSRGALRAPLEPLAKAELDRRLAEPHDGEQPSVLVVGALGRCGRGALDALATAGLAATGWDVAETRQLDRSALLDHDLLLNTVLTTRAVEPFLRPADLDEPLRRLSVICDVTCDVTSAFNVLPVYDTVTSWQQPVRRLREGKPLDLIAIDNLPSLLPAEASRAFSAELLPQLLPLALGEAAAPAWQRCLSDFRTACRANDLEAPDA